MLGIYEVISGLLDDGVVAFRIVARASLRMSLWGPGLWRLLYQTLRASCLSLCLTSITMLMMVSALNRCSGSICSNDCNCLLWRF